MVPYFGCGCGTGPSARSLPAAAAAWIVFGPAVAFARVAAGAAAARLLPRAPTCGSNHTASVLTELRRLLPCAAIASAVPLATAALAGSHPPALPSFAIASVLTFLSAPCALGSISLAAAVRVSSPAACAAILCLAGICDVRAWQSPRAAAGSHDVFAYILLALACANVAVHGGAGFVHPVIAIALWACAAASMAYAFVHRNDRCAGLRIAPAIMFAGSLLAAPPPEYHATETTLTGAFAGEHLDFTGVLTRTRGTATIVRYAITCCRADAAPVVVRLTFLPANLHGWVRANGTLVQRNGELELQTAHIGTVVPPADPFIYR